LVDGHGKQPTAVACRRFDASPVPGRNPHGRFLISPHAASMRSDSSPTPAAPDVLEALRAATGERHRRLDGGMPLSVAAPGAQHYREHLLLMRPWLAAIECWQARPLAPGFGPARRDASDAIRALPTVQRLPALDADLLALGADPTSHTIDVGQWPADAAFGWGVGYVVEGSQLGGAVLYRKLKPSLPGHALHFLGEGRSPALRWHAFVEALRAAVAGAESITRACDGARAAFDGLLALLEQRGAPGAEPAQGLIGLPGPHAAQNHLQAHRLPRHRPGLGAAGVAT